MHVKYEDTLLLEAPRSLHPSYVGWCAQKVQETAAEILSVSLGLSCVVWNKEREGVQRRGCESSQYQSSHLDSQQAVSCEIVVRMQIEIEHQVTPPKKSSWLKMTGWLAGRGLSSTRFSAMWFVGG